jgi:tetratricopeptide (TPR) repeat protein
VAADFAYQRLARGVAAGEDPAELRRDFGSTLSLGGDHREAVQVLERALAERPDDLETMLVLALARIQAGHVEGAEALQARLAELAPGDPRTWLLEARIHRRCTRWEAQARAADRALALRPDGDERRRHPLAYRADAWLGLERWDAFAADVAALRAIGSPGARAQAEVLALRRLCRTERWTEGLAGAARLLRGAHLGLDRSFVEAVRFECAHRLARPSAAGELGPHAIEVLRSAGQGAWVDRLAADFGL